MINENKSLLTISTIIFILTLGTGIVAPILSPYSKGMGASGIWIGIIYSGFYMVRFVVGTPVGILSDKYGAKKMLTVSLLMYPFIALTYLFADSLVSLLGARLFHGVASTMMLPMAMTYIGLITPKGKESSYMGVYNSFLFIANGLGPLLGGWVASEYGYRASFLGLLVFALVSLVLTAKILPSVNGKSFSKKEEVQDGSNTRLLSFSNSNFLGLINVYFAIAVISMFYISFFPLYGMELGFNTVQIGALISIFNITVGVCQIPFGKLVDRMEKVKVLFISNIGIGFILVSIPLFHSFFVTAFFALILSLFFSLAVSSSSGMATEMGRQFKMGKVMGFLASISSLGMIVGPLLSGLILDYLSFSWLFGCLGGMWFIASVLLIGRKANSEVQVRKLG
ncbi:MFS transporter [Peribacillus acanthi]|uniref:MFS transporter n=1 Tax=Peribacillus acanthi TaxID=2171554 RepID=UPI000D3E8647|nr:MFS transporter [Peribacillus acanthi]